jgi:subtilisin-like proprotein convertase family protein
MAALNREPILEQMKKQFLIGTLLTLLAASGARGALFIENFTGGDAVGVIPDGSPIGVTFSGTVSDAPGMTVSELTLTLNISGGFNGNLFAYLNAPDGTHVVLMNQPGVSGENPFGASGAGMNITLQDSGAINGPIQTETSAAVLSGSYNAAGTLTDFNGAALNGIWELFFADEVSGGGTSTLNSSSLGINAVPEPVNMALVIFSGFMVIGTMLARRARGKNAVKVTAISLPRNFTRRKARKSACSC